MLRQTDDFQRVDRAGKSARTVEREPAGTLCRGKHSRHRAGTLMPPHTAREYPDLVDDPKTKQVANNVYMIEEFVAREMQEHAGDLQFDQRPRNILFHGHCHQKAIVGTAPRLEILNAIPNATVTEIDSGCCGMAGSFGFEKEHYGLSESIGARSLFRRLKNLKMPSSQRPAFRAANKSLTLRSSNRSTLSKSLQRHLWCRSACCELGRTIL